MSAVTGQTVADFIGVGDDADIVALAGQHAAIVTQMARSYTRGRGFTAGTPNAQIAAAITSATARLVANPEQLSTTVGSESVRGGFNGWTLPELYVLNRFRARAL